MITADLMTFRNRSLPSAPVFGRGKSLALVLATILFLATYGCSNEDDQSSVLESPSPSPTPAPRDPAAAEETLHSFVEAVQAGHVEEAWALYAGDVPGNTPSHWQNEGCDYGVFTFEFPKIKHLFERAAPFTIEQWYGSALGVSVVELSVRGADGVSYLATLARSKPYGPYQVRFLNNGRPALIPGVPDPLPSPEDPMGFCGIWTGAR
jgi:hypothetical protein